MMKIKDKLDTELIFILRKKGFTQSKIADLLNVSVSTINKILKESILIKKDKYIFQVNCAWNEYTIIVTDDINQILEESIINQLDEDSCIYIWLNGKQIENDIKLEDNESYDSLYVKLMTFLNKQKE